MPSPETRPDGGTVTIRARILLAMVLLAGFALLISGVLVAAIQHRNNELDIDDQLQRTYDELRVLASVGVDPQTGEAFTGPGEVLRTYLQRTVIGPTEGEFAFVGSQIAFVASEDVQVRPEEDQQLVAAVTPLTGQNKITITTIKTDQRHYRVLVAPVVFPQQRGALVHVVDTHMAGAELRRTMTLYGIVAAITVAVLIVPAWLLVGRLLHPIEELRKAAEAIDDRDLTSRVPVRGKDDLSALSATINGMLDRLQVSVEQQRQLLDDVGHELRTPVTVLRGHLELVDPEDPHDVRATRDLAIDELDRMNVLVNDLLMLAKANEVDFIRPEWTDLAMLTDSTLEKAKALGERHWRLERVSAAEAWLDSGRITQAWLQLAANAVKYSQPGTQVALGSRLERGEVWLWVSDQGIGIAPDQLEKVRERFGRTAEAARHAQGAGLGLSIVESIATAHGGRLDIDSTQGGGSTVSIVLPLGPREALDRPVAEEES